MMKKLLLIAALMLSAITTMHAQDSSNQAWWGYTTQDDSFGGVGVGSADTYHCAIFIPGNHGVAGGKTIRGVRFAIRAQHYDNIIAWVAQTRPSAITSTKTVRMANVDNSAVNNGYVEVSFNEGYEIPSTGCYVGFSFDVTTASVTNDKYPVPVVATTDEPNALWLRTEQAQKAWINLNGQGYGRLYLQVLLEGEFNQNAASPQNFGTYIIKGGEQTAASINVVNMGTEPITSIDYAMEVDGEQSAEQHLNLTNPIGSFATGTVNITLAASESARKEDRTLIVTKVNGEPNETDQNQASCTVYTLNEIVDRNVVVEEYTGTGCGWCPRGLVGMEKLRTTFGDRFVGIGLHRYNQSDPMYLANGKYANISFSGAPSCRINRGAEIDPYYGSTNDIRNDFRTAMAVPALAAVEANAYWNSDSTAVDAEANVTALFDGTDMKVELVLIADGLKSSNTAWRQSNYYYQYDASQVGSDLSMFAAGGKFGNSTISNWTFNDVAIVSSYVNGTNQADAVTNLANGETATVRYTLPLASAQQQVLNVLKKDQVFLAALIIAPDGSIANAVKVQVKGYDLTGIANVNGAQTSLKDTANYTIDGRRTNTQQRGLNLIRMSDGTVRKVLVK